MVLSNIFGDYFDKVIPKPVVVDNSPSLIDEIDKSLESRTPSYRSPGFHCSQIYDVCPREEALKSIHGDTPEVIGADLQKIFDMGHKLHEMVQEDWLGPTGQLYGRWYNARDPGNFVTGHQTPVHTKYSEPSLKVKVPGIPEDEEDYYLVGHCDGILDEMNSTLEIKGVSPSIFPSMEEQYNLLLNELNDFDWYTLCGEPTRKWGTKYARAHFFQSGLYTKGFSQTSDPVISKVRWSHMLYVNKANLKMFERRIPISDIPLETAFRKIRAVYNHKETGDLPKGVCSSQSCTRASKCPVAAECFRAGNPLSPSAYGGE